MSKRTGGFMMTVTGPMPVSASLAKVRRYNTEVARRARRVILARTAASRSALDARAAGADMTDVADLPVITGLAPKRPMRATDKRKRPKPKRAPAAMAALPDREFLQRMAAL